MLMKVHEQHHIGVGRHGEVMVVGHHPLVRGGPRVKKTTIDEARACGYNLSESTDPWEAKVEEQSL
jgi:hypothetical protein